MYKYFYALAPGLPTQDHIGGWYTSITRAYPPGYISALPSGCRFGEGHIDQEWRTLDVQDLHDPQQNWQSSRECEVPHDFADFGGPNGTKMAASPVISLPADIRTYDPAWGECGVSPQVRPIILLEIFFLLTLLAGI